MFSIRALSISTPCALAFEEWEKLCSLAASFSETATSDSVGISNEILLCARKRLLSLCKHSCVRHSRQPCSSGLYRKSLKSGSISMAEIENVSLYIT